MASGMIHLLVASSGVDSKQLVHQLDDSHRPRILLVELDCVDKVPSRMAPTGRMHHLWAPYAAIIGRIAVCLENPLEVDKEMRWTFAIAAHAKIEAPRPSRSAVLPHVGLVILSATVLSLHIHRRFI